MTWRRICGDIARNTASSRRAVAGSVPPMTETACAVRANQVQHDQLQQRHPPPSPYHGTRGDHSPQMRQEPIDISRCTLRRRVIGLGPITRSSIRAG
jgi:hypothetical protein